MMLFNFKMGKGSSLPRQGLQSYFESGGAGKWLKVGGGRGGG